MAKVCSYVKLQFVDGTAELEVLDPLPKVFTVLRVLGIQVL